MKLSDIAEVLGGECHGSDVDIERVGSLDCKFDKAILYVEKKKYLNPALAMNPAAIVVGHGLEPENDIPYIVVEYPKHAFIKLLELFAPKRAEYSGIDTQARIADGAVIHNTAAIMPGAVILDGAQIGENSAIYPGCVIEQDAEIGKNSVLYSGVVVRAGCVIGENCIIHSGTVIGSDGFGYYENDGEIIKIPQIGIVKIGDNVEIGANCCIDRATVGITEIGNDTKLDNMVHIAHNVRIGSKCYLAAMAAISGSVNIGDHVAIMGQVGVGDHVSIADGTVVLGQSGILNDIKKPEILFGTPARQVREHHKIHSSLKYVPELLKRVKSLEDKLKGDDN